MSRYRRFRDHRANRRLACNRRSGRSRGSDNVRRLTGLRDDAARRGRCSWSWRWCSSSSRGRDGDSRSRRSRCRRCNMNSGRRRGYNSRGARRRSLGSSLGLLTLEDRLERIARLGDLGEVDLRLDVGLWLTRARGAVSTVEVVAYFLSLIGLDRAGVRLSSNADRFKRIENRPALYFQFSCQIIDSNFAHPSLFAFPAPLAVHISLIEVGIFGCKYYR